MPSLRDIRRARLRTIASPPPSPRSTQWLAVAHGPPGQMSEFVASIILSQIMVADDGHALELAVRQSEQAQEVVPQTISQADARQILNPRRWSRGYARDDDPKACPICMETFKYPRSVARLPCGHLFCSSCIRKWLTTYSSTCCVCRSTVGEAASSSDLTSEPDTGFVSQE